MKVHWTPLFLTVALCHLCACGTTGKHKNDPRLNVTFSEFDQADDRGWRSLVSQRRFDEADGLIEAYMDAHREMNRDQQALLRFHRGQLLAIQSKKRAAISELRQAYSTAGSSLPASWNAYIDGILSFLQRDREKLESIAAQLERTKNTEYLAAINALLQNFDASYESIVYPK